jgi:hypothetical protein
MISDPHPFFSMSLEPTRYFKILESKNIPANTFDAGLVAGWRRNTGIESNALRSVRVYAIRTSKRLQDWRKF